MEERKDDQRLRARALKCLRCKKYTEDRPETVCRLIQSTAIKNDFYCAFFEGSNEETLKNEALLQNHQLRGAAFRYPHALMVEFDYCEGELDELFHFERELEALIRKKRAGHYDGHEWRADGTATRLYMYTHNAEALFRLIRPMLEVWPCLKNGTAYLRFGRLPNAPEIDIKIES